MLKKETKPGRKPGKKFWLLLTAAILVLTVAAFFIVRPLLKGNTAAAQTTAAVTRGSIIRTIEGSGVISANDQYTVSSLVTGEVLADHFEEGDTVQEGDLLYEIDSSDLDYNLQKAESSITTARLSYEESLETLDNMTVTAPISGVLSSLSVKEGDELSAGKQVAEIISSDRMVLSLCFLTSDAQMLHPGDPASVVPENSPSQTLSGTVKSVATGSIANSLGVAVTNVEILVDNPGGLQNGGRATATVGTYACNEAGTFSYEDTETVTVKTGGTVTGLSLRTGDRVTAGTVLFTLTSDSTSRSIERSRITYNDAVSGYNNTYDQLDDYRITAPISGKVIQKSVKAGDKLESGSGGNASSMAIIADLSILTFEMSVDELDIAEIEEGQAVQITADAVEGKRFKGHVDNVSIVGTTSNGVTSYPVKVVLDGAENAELIPGMNVSATIITEQKENVLLIPASAVSRGNLVAVKGTKPADAATEAPKATPEELPSGGSTAVESDSARMNRKAADIAMRTDAPEGFYYVQIETGITDGTYIEVISGLSEGDVILLPSSAGDASTSMQFTPNAQNTMMGGMPGMGGGMPGMSGMGGGGMSGGMRR